MITDPPSFKLNKHERMFYRIPAEEAQGFVG